MLQLNNNLKMYQGIILQTYHLERCQIFFPPDKLLILWTHRRYHVVEIHNNMNE